MSANPANTISVDVMLSHVSAIENAVTHLTITERVNACAYLVVAYICAECPPTERAAATARFCEAVRDHYLPAMAEVHDRAATILAATAPAGETMQ